MLRAGPVIVIEWASTPKAIIVTAGTQTHRIAPFRSASRGRALYPFAEKLMSEDENWVDFEASPD